MGFALLGFMSSDASELQRHRQVGFHVKRTAAEEEGANKVMNVFLEGFE